MEGVLPTDINCADLSIDIRNLLVGVYKPGVTGVTGVVQLDCHLKPVGMYCEISSLYDHFCF